MKAEDLGVDHPHQITSASGFRSGRGHGASRYPVGLHECRLSASGTLRVLAQTLAHPQELLPGFLERLANGLVEPEEVSPPARWLVLRIKLLQHDRRSELPLDEALQIRDHPFNDVPEGAPGP